VSRHSLKNVRRQVRGALGATTRADARYGDRVDIELRLRLVRRALLEAEKQLGLAMRDARTPRQVRRAA
jgi:hypothetical protein